MFNFVRVSDGGPARLDGPRTEVEILAELGRRVLGEGGPVDWRQMEQHASIRGLMAKVIPGLESLALVDRDCREFTIPGRVLHTPRFATPSGKAHFAAVSLPPPADGLRMMTIRSEGQFNTVVYEEDDIYRGQERRDVILLHPDDLARRGLADDQRVTVRSAAGEMTVRTRAFAQVRPGNVLMYFPEANALVPTAVDPDSKTPAFKSVPVTVEAESVIAPADMAGRRQLAQV